MRLNSFTIDWAWFIKVPVVIKAITVLWGTPEIWILFVMLINTLSATTNYTRRGE